MLRLLFAVIVGFVVMRPRVPIPTSPPSVEPVPGSPGDVPEWSPVPELDPVTTGVPPTPPPGFSGDWPPPTTRPTIKERIAELLRELRFLRQVEATTPVEGSRDILLGAAESTSAAARSTSR